MRVPADNHVNAGDVGGDFLVLGKAHMGHRDDLVDAFGGQGLGLSGEAVDHVLEHDVVAGRGGFIGVFGKRRNEADLFAADFHDMGARNAAFEQGLVFDIGVTRNQRVFDSVEQGGQLFGAVVEFVVAHGHQVDAKAVGEFSDDLAAILGVEQ